MAHKFVLRLPESVYKEVSKLAKDDGVSINYFITNAVVANVEYYKLLEKNKRDYRNKRNDKNKEQTLSHT